MYKMACERLDENIRIFQQFKKLNLNLYKSA
jgi:hypothetical protein